MEFESMTYKNDMDKFFESFEESNENAHIDSSFLSLSIDFLFCLVYNKQNARNYF